MTLIIGLNMSDGIYLAADTRVTVTDNSNQKQLFVDNVLKITPLFGKHILDKDCSTDILISIAVAGDVKFANFIKDSLKTALYEKSLSSDIRELYDQLDENCFARLSDKWLSNSGGYNKECAFIIGGYGIKKPRKINIRRINQMVEIYKKEHVFDDKKEKEIRQILEEDKTMQLINKKVKLQAHKNIFELLVESSHPQIPSIIQDAVRNQKNDISELPDLFLFCVELGIHKEKLHFKKCSAEYGEYIARGQGGITEDEIPDSLLATIDLSPNKHKNQEHLLEGALISKTILDIAKEKKLTGIGGTVIINSIKYNKSQIMSGNSKMINNRLHINIHNKFVEPVFFSKIMDVQIPINSTAKL